MVSADRKDMLSHFSVCDSCATGWIIGVCYFVCWCVLCVLVFVWLFHVLRVNIDCSIVSKETEKSNKWHLLEHQMRILLDTLLVYLLQSPFVCAESAFAVSVSEVGVVHDAADTYCTEFVISVAELGEGLELVVA